MTDTRVLTVAQLTRLGMIAEAVEQGRRIARLLPDGEIEWGIARAFTHDGGGFLSGADDVRDGFIWVSAGNRLSERWWSVSDLLLAFDRGEVSLGYEPSERPAVTELTAWEWHALAAAIAEREENLTDRGDQGETVGRELAALRRAKGKVREHLVSPRSWRFRR